MKKGDASKARRRTTANFSLLRKFDHGDESTKDGLQVVTEKVVLDSNSAWYGAEIIYIVRTVRKTKKGARNNTQISAVAQPSESLRYLILLRRRDAQQNVILLRVNLKDDEVETKNHFELRALRSIDFGSEVDNELLLSFDSADQNIFFVTQTDRDEALWIVIQVCKNVLTIELTIGYSIDIDALSFITNTNGTLSRFPVLQKMVQAHTKDLGDFFSNEETEAENLLDELQWGKSQGQTGLKQVLAVQSAQISDEIIDFLVQWEEMDEHAVQAGPIEGMSDTSEVLTALSHVDEELHAVDEWLGEQIERLEEIQSNLHMIEDESGALESSWNSLQSVQEVVTSLVNRYSLSAEHEQLLKSQGQLQAVLRAPTLDRVGRSLAPLVGAMQTVRDAIKLRFEDVADVSSAQWKQLQNLSSIATQKGKLHDAVDSCCDALSDTALGLFEWLLKHRVMSEGGLAMKQFPLGPVLKWQGAAADPEGLAALPDWLGAVCGEGNALIRVKGLYEKNLTHFLPLLDLFAELSPAALAPLQDKYVRSVAEGLYRPLFRVLRRDLALVTAKQTVVTLANCAAYRIKSGPHLLLTFANGSIKGHVSAGAAHSLTPWGALKLALLVVVPALEREEAFMKVREGERGRGRVQEGVREEER
ncbi:hypothetical protein B484DRAFT_209581 [Ochromonadaceae sp. CCMP2298]|nr:hypothetical protein B484DRAFT_209581 [Ochromonadaceae sp. CCMP2298]